MSLEFNSSHEAGAASSRLNVRGLKQRPVKSIKFNKIKLLIFCYHSQAAAVLTLKGGRKAEEHTERMRQQRETAAVDTA